MLENEPTGTGTDGADLSTPTTSPEGRPRRRRAATRPAGPPQVPADRPEPVGEAPVAAEPAAPAERPAEPLGTPPPDTSVPAEEPPAAKPIRARRTTRKAAAGPEGVDQATTARPARTRRTRSVAAAEEPAGATDTGIPAEETDTDIGIPAGETDTDIGIPAGETDTEVIDVELATLAAEAEAEAEAGDAEPSASGVVAPPALLFRPPSPADTAAEAAPAPETAADTGEEEEPGAEGARRRRRRGGRGRRGRARADGAEPEDEDTEPAMTAEASGAAEAGEAGEAGEAEEAEEDLGEDAAAAAEDLTAPSRRRRRRRRGSSGGDVEQPSGDDPERTVVHIREPRRAAERARGDEVSSVRGSTRLEAKKQRRREGREQGRRRPPVITEAEFLARRESVERVMVIRQVAGRTQIGVLEDGVLVEHYVNREASTSFVGNVYLGKVQNVLPSMEAAFVDIGKGRNAVLYAGEVNWDAAGLDGQPKRIESALKSGDSLLVQVTKDPMGHKGARLTSQISLPGRFLVYVPDGSMTGISRKLPDTERSRLKQILKRVVPDDAGVIVRTAAEGATEIELERDVARLRAQWDDIVAKSKARGTSAPALLYGEPDLAIRVVRDVFNEDFAKIVVSGEDAWDTVDGYVGHVAPDLAARLERWNGTEDVFTAHRIDEQLTKALDRKVWLPSGGYLVIDDTEAMTVVDVNTGKFTGKGGNLEETVTKNNLEAAEEVVRQLRLRDIGGIIVVDFIDMVLESNRELVLRRLLECLGRDRTKHQVAEVTSLGLVQMTRKRVGQGLLEAFSEPCEHCKGRGVVVHLDPVEQRPAAEARLRRERESRPVRPAHLVAAPEAEPEAAPEAEPEAEPEAAPEAEVGTDERVTAEAVPAASPEGRVEPPRTSLPNGEVGEVGETSGRPARKARARHRAATSSPADVSV